MLFREKLYLQDQLIIKSYGKNLIKLVHMNKYRNPNVENDDTNRFRVVGINSEKLYDNIIRSRSVLLELVLCNPWDYFFTGTFSPEKYDRTDLSNLNKLISQWIRNYNKKYSTHIKYVLVPELHGDRENWHMHGLIFGLPKSHLSQFQIGDIMGKGIAEKVKNNQVVFNWSAYALKFGFCDLEPIRDINKTASYLAKYISKDFNDGVTELNKHKYYASKGLNRAKREAFGNCDIPIEWDYSNDFCCIKTLPYSEQVLEELKRSIY